MINRIGFGVAACLLMALVFGKPGIGTQVQPKCKLHVVNLISNVVSDNKLDKVTTFATLYLKGQAVRSQELPWNPAYHSVVWIDLDPGSYEIQFETKGFGKVIKRMILSPEAMGEVSVESVNRNDEVWGGGPSLFELQGRIKSLEDRVSMLEKKS